MIIFIDTKENQNHLLLTDSLSSLFCLQNQWTNYQYPTAEKIIQLIYSNPPLHITYACILGLGYKGIPGNNLTDKPVKQEVINFPILNIPIPLTDFCRTIKLNLKERWKQQWSNSGHYHLLSIKPFIGKWKSDSHSIADTKLFLYVFILATLFSLSHFFTRTPRPVCPRCSVSSISIQYNPSWLPKHIITASKSFSKPFHITPTRYRLLCSCPF